MSETLEWETLEELQGIHIIDENDVLDPQELYRKIEPYLDYEIFYAEDRIEQIKENWDEELYVRCISTEKFRGQQVKKTASLLSESTPMTYHLDKLSDYILYAHYDNAEQEEEFNKLAEELKLKRKDTRPERNKKRIIEVKDELKKKPSMMTSRNTIDKRKIEKTDNIENFFKDGANLDTAENYFPTIAYTKVDKELNQQGHFKNNQRYWAHYAPLTNNKVPHFTGELVPYANLAYNSIANIEKEIKVVETQIVKLEESQDIFIKNNSYTDENEKKIEVRSPELDSRIKQLSRFKRDIRGEYNLAAEILRKRVELKSSISAPSEQISKDSWERMSMRNEEIYLALLLGYSELKEHYDTKVGTTMWCMLHVFDELAEKAIVDRTEKLILEILLTDGGISNKTIQDEILESLHKEVPISTVNDTINKTLPKRIREVYEQELEEWIWTYRRKGEYKTCKKCEDVKLIKHFSRQRTYKDGYSNICKKCEAIRVKAYETT